jgi:hypothetical protein
MPYRTSIERLRELLSYSPDTGEFFWRGNLKGSARIGGRAGSFNHSGYRRVCIDGRDLMLHRVAWAMTYGRWPGSMIDHLNGNRADNRIENLREADAGMNMQNRRRAAVHNQTGILGAHKTQSGRFRAKITLNGLQMIVGTFDTPEEAHSAYLEAKRQLHPGCTI